MRFSIRPEVEGGQGKGEIREKRQVELEEKNEILPGVSLNKIKQNKSNWFGKKENNLIL